jgi:hypothetical protein
MNRKTLRTIITLVGAVTTAIIFMPKTRPEQPRARACDALADWDQKIASERDTGVSPATAMKAITENDEPLHSILLNHVAAIYQAPRVLPAGVRSESFDACMKGETELSLRVVK